MREEVHSVLVSCVIETLTADAALLDVARLRHPLIFNFDADLLFGRSFATGRTFIIPGMSFFGFVEDISFVGGLR